MSRSKNESFDVSDSTDWLQTPLPKLAPVDSALRCQVCRDFYNTPMITSCSHTFCSLCIRHCLNNDAKCPTCRKGDQESKLRNNYALEELVEAFKVARPQVMDLTKTREGSKSSPKRKRIEETTEDHSSPVRKRTRSGTKAHQSSQMVEILDSDSEDDAYEPELKPSQIECPMCRDGFPTERAVEAHLDHCTGEPASKKPKSRSTQSSLPPQMVSKPSTKRPERLATLNYSMVKDAALRQKMMNLGISAAGSRPLMERRYTEWVTLWNANCDSKNPKVSRELKRELEVWERTQGGQMAGRMSSGGNVRDKDFDREDWSKSNDDAFKDLVAQARKRAAKREEPPKAESALPVPVYNSPYTQALPAQQPFIESRPHATVYNPLLIPEEPRTETVVAPPPGTSPQRRFFEDGPAPFEPPSSQHPGTQIMDKDIGISSDIATLRPLQP